MSAISGLTKTPETSAAETRKHEERNSTTIVREKPCDNNAPTIEGPKKEPKLPTMLIKPIDAAAAVSPKISVGSTQKEGPHE